MSDSIDIRRNLGLEQVVDDAIGAINYDAVALKAIDIMLEKTASHVDYENQPFRRYSNFYRDVREDKQLPIQPDLFFTGNMLSSITSESDSNSAVVGFLDRENSNKAYRHITGSGVPQRDFFFINDDDTDELLTIAMRFFDEEFQ